MTKNDQKVREQVNEMEQAADIALAAVRAEPGVRDEVRSGVERLHEWARQAKQSVGEPGDQPDPGRDLATLRGHIAAAEEAADQALEDAKNDPGVGKATRSAIQEAHDAAKKAKNLF